MKPARQKYYISKYFRQLSEANEYKHSVTEHDTQKTYDYTHLHHILLLDETC